MPNFSDLFGSSSIKSVQRGVSMVGLVTVAAVNPARSELRYLGSSESGGYLSFVSGTQIEVNRGAASSTVKISWELTEYYA